MSWRSRKRKGVGITLLDRLWVATRRLEVVASGRRASEIGAHCLATSLAVEQRTAVRGCFPVLTNVS